MARYIDAVELIKAIEENQRNTEHHKDGRGKQIHVSEHRHFIKMVYEQPTADVQEVRHGHWFILEYEYFTCSECGYYHPNGCDTTKEAKEQLADGRYPKYCSECGALMDGKE